MPLHIKVKTAGLLGQYLPSGSARNEAEITVPEDATPLDVLGQLGMPQGDTYLMTHNGALLPVKARPSTQLGDGDELGIFPPLKGG